ncbi:MAG: hypothetical protein NVSMB33_13300 [Ktedonobacteraceae bacterium]
MIQKQGEALARHCPRCGGLMAKPTGSRFYWHADHNHPRCDITNIADPLITVQTTETPLQSQPELPEAPKDKRRKK